MIKRKIDRLGKQYGVSYSLNEMGEKKEGKDTMHYVILKPDTPDSATPANDPKNQKAA